MVANSLGDIVLSPQEVREMLNTDNDEIISLCRRASIIPKRNNRGLTYFSYDEVKHLQKMKEMKTNLVRINPNNVVDKIMQSFSEMENKISTNILNTVDERLDTKLKGVEEIVIELIKYQSENEKLKNKITELNRENIQLKSELNNYKEIGLGFFKKGSKKDYSI